MGRYKITDLDIKDNSFFFTLMNIKKLTRKMTIIKSHKLSLKEKDYIKLIIKNLNIISEK